MWLGCRRKGRVQDRERAAGRASRTILMRGGGAGRSTALRHLARAGTDPFNRAPLTREMLLARPGLRRRIRRFVAEKLGAGETEGGETSEEGETSSEEEGRAARLEESSEEERRSARENDTAAESEEEGGDTAGAAAAAQQAPQ